MHEAVESWRVRINLDSEISWRAAREAIVPAAFSEGPVQLSVLKEGGRSSTLLWSAQILLARRNYELLS
jgi:hypothetical protein